MRTTLVFIKELLNFKPIGAGGQDGKKSLEKAASEGDSKKPPQPTSIKTRNQIRKEQGISMKEFIGEKRKIMMKVEEAKQSS